MLEIPVMRGFGIPTSFLACLRPGPPRKREHDSGQRTRKFDNDISQARHFFLARCHLQAAVQSKKAETPEGNHILRQVGSPPPREDQTMRSIWLYRDKLCPLFIYSSIRTKCQGTGAASGRRTQMRRARNGTDERPRDENGAWRRGNDHLYP